MDFLDSLDLHTFDKKSNRVRSWYLYEQYKSLEKSQLDAARKLKNKSYQDRILHRELSERRARRQFNQRYDPSQSDSRIGRTVKRELTRAPFSDSADSFFESVCEQEDVVSEKESDTVSQLLHDTCNFYDFKPSSSKNNNSCSESVNCIIEKSEIKDNVGNDIKNELEFVKKNIAEIINLQMETEKECLEKCSELCDEKCTFNDSLKSIDKLDEKCAKSVDKYNPKYDNGLFVMWSKLVAFSYNIIQMNRGNCYYDYSSQFLTGVLAFDVLRRGINRMCDILQPFVSPIKFASDEPDIDSLTIDFVNQKHSDPKNASKNVEYKSRPQRKLKYNEKYCSFKRTYHSEDKWQSCCKYSYENMMNEMQRHGASEPWRSAIKFSDGKSKDKLSCKIKSYQNNKNCSSYCSCRQLRKAINPIMKLSHYIDLILQEIED